MAIGHQPFSISPSTKYHLLTKPTVNGTPIRLRPETKNAEVLRGIILPSPDKEDSLVVETR